MTEAPSGAKVVLVGPVLLAEAVASTLGTGAMKVAGVASNAAAREITERIRAQRRNAAAVIVAGAACSDDDVVAFIEAGACACVGSDAPLRELHALVQAAQRGEPVWSARVAALVARRLAGLARAEQATVTIRLSPRERDILALLAAGHAVKEIAAVLDLRPATVKAHLRGAYRKLGVRTRRAAVIHALRSR